MTMLGDRQRLAYIASQAADARLNVELETEGMTLNIGPQHPATHGTLRIICRLDGEQVVWAEPSAGYMHRGYEKLTEVRTFPQVTSLVNRIDWLGSFANEVPFILAAEKLMDIEAAQGKVFNTGSDQPVSILQLAKRVIEKVDPKVQIEFMPYNQAYSEDFEDVQRRVPNVDRLFSTIGQKPTSGLDTILDDVIAWKRSLSKSGTALS